MDTDVIYFCIAGKTSGKYIISTSIILTDLVVSVQLSAMNAKRVLVGVTIGLVLGLIIVGYRGWRAAQRGQSDSIDRARLDDEREVGIIKL
jgi:hypothetical protein